MNKINTLWIKESKDYPKSKERSTDIGQREKKNCSTSTFFSVFNIKERSMEFSEININGALGISTRRINKKQVKEYLDNLNIYDSEGLSRIQPKDLKELAAKVLTDIFQTSWKRLGTKGLKKDES